MTAFADLTPVHPSARLRLETGPENLIGRVVDLLAPVGKGQRGLIVAPPRTGKTTVLHALAEGVVRNHPECTLLVLLLDERPEEVTDFARRLDALGHGGRAEVLASTFDHPAKEHIALADRTMDRAKRLVEQGRDVVVLMDSLTRLCRAHNTAAPANSRILTGGVAASALLGPKRVFGAARDTEGGGSLTVLATVLVETGSRADDYFFEELKSTGNMELRLDRALARARVFPAVAAEGTGTRRDELLVPREELDAAHALRRALHTSLETESLLKRLRATPGNAHFIRQITHTGQLAA